MVAEAEIEPTATQGRRRGLHEVKIFGERNTGTTALKRLIERNSSSTVCPSVAVELDPLFGLKMEVLRRAPRRYRRRLTETYIDRVFRRVTPRLAWKHTATAFDEIHSFDGCPVIVMTRHPASWLLGLHHHPYHALVSVDRDLSAFLRAHWIPVKRDNLDRRALLPGDLWNAKTRSQLSLVEKLSKANMQVRVVKFEDFVVDQKATFHTLKGILVNPADQPEIIERSTKDRTKDFRYYEDYYREERWKSDITRESAELIDQSIDWVLAGDVGYKRP
jgi:hypothetical protein